MKDIFQGLNSRQADAEKTIILDENYRSTPRILDIANCVIANNVTSTTPLSKKVIQ